MRTHEVPLFPILMLLAGMAFAESADETSVAASRPYSVSVHGVPDRALRRLILDVSDSESRRAEGPVTADELERRLKSDLASVRDVLRAEGYFAGTVRANIRIRPKDYRGRLLVDLGPLYRWGRFSMEWAGIAPEPPVTWTGVVDFAEGKPYRSSLVVEAEQEILRACGRRGFPTARVENRTVTVDHATTTVHVDWRLNLGPRARFGEAEILGLDRVRPRFVRNLVPWTEGQVYRSDRVQEFRNELYRSGLFRLVSVKEGPEIQADDRWPVVVDLRERKPRTLSTGAGYRTDEGWGMSAAWEHRNLFGGAEALDSEAIFAEKRKLLEAGFKKPQFARSDQTLLMRARTEEVESDAYLSRNQSGSLLLERQLLPSLKVRGGGAARFSSVDEQGRDRTYELLSAPLESEQDRSDNVLDPSRGHRWLAHVEPFLDVSDPDVTFTKMWASASAYRRPGRRSPLVLAGRFAAGSIVGQNAEVVPADLRFYSGGGGSVRGYAYQSVGPLEGRTPLGGASMVEMSGELRYRITPSFGCVLFLDGGTAYDGPVPDQSDPIRWGAGCGLRYHTPVGPVRADIAFPLDRRDGVDDRYQFYISVGQAF